MKGLGKNLKRFVILSIILFLAACGGEEETSGNAENGAESDGETINIVTTIAQIGEPLSVIGGDRVEVNSLMGPSVDPHLYQATQGDISTIEEADLIFYNGLNLEANMVDIFNEISEAKPVLAIGEATSEEALLEDPDEAGAPDPH